MGRGLPSTGNEGATEYGGREVVCLLGGGGKGDGDLPPGPTEESGLNAEGSSGHCRGGHVSFSIYDNHPETWVGGAGEGDRRGSARASRLDALPQGLFLGCLKWLRPVCPVSRDG